MMLKCACCVPRSAMPVPLRFAPQYRRFPARAKRGKSGKSNGQAFWLSFFARNRYSLLMIFAVLTGDIVASTDLGKAALDETLVAIATAADEIGTWPQVSVTGFARRGGDAWQMALYVQACLRRLDKARASRIAIATGAGEMPGTDPNAAHGAAFTASGRLLDTLPAALCLDHAAGGAEAAAARLADHIAQGWTVAQARALALQLPPGSGPRAEAAAALGISRQAVNQALWSAGFPAIIAALSALEAEGCK